MRRGDDGHARVGHARDVRAFFFSMTRMRRVGFPVLEETCNGVPRRGRYAHKPPMQGAISSEGKTYFLSGRSTGNYEQNKNCFMLKT